MESREMTVHISRIREIKDNYTDIMNHWRAESGEKIICTGCDSIPPEITAALGIRMVRFPSFMKEQNCGSIFDAFIQSEGADFCFGGNSISAPHYKVTLPGGYGEDAAVSIHNETASMLEEVFSVNLKSISPAELQHVTAHYERLRRTVRGICSGRTLRPSLLSQEDLSLIFETALILPPEAALDYIEPIHQIIKSSPPENTEEYRTKALLYCSGVFPGIIADEIEKEGILISEDDCCLGRRSFDMSLNHESEYLFYELLDSYSYRPLHPCLRHGEERFELLYRLLKNYGIETVIFITGEGCTASDEQADYLRIKMMRQGIDPLTVTNSDYIEKIRDYVSRM